MHLCDDCLKCFHTHKLILQFKDVLLSGRYILLQLL